MIFLSSDEVAAKYHNQFVTGDCLPILKSFPAGCVNLAVYSPPYRFTPRKTPKAGGVWSGVKDVTALGGDNDLNIGGMTENQYIAWQQECISEVLRVLDDEGAIFYNHRLGMNKGLITDYPLTIVKPFPVRQIIIWNRMGSLVFGTGFFRPTYQIVVLIAKKKFKLRPQMGHVGDVWDIAPAHGNPHPSPYPVELALRCIDPTYAEVVLDPFSGSGTTAVAAHLLGRKFIAIDKDDSYMQMAREGFAERVRLQK